MNKPLLTVRAAHFRRRALQGLSAAALIAGLLVVAGVPLLARTAPSDAASVKKGAALYQQKCATCHGLKGKGDGPTARTSPTTLPDFAAGEYPRGETDDQIYNNIMAGIPGTLMNGWKGRLSETETLQVIAYLRTLKK
ncbi:MAG: cytochrome c [Armatimonadetes bacterium]|nr:cytochrome c [Armatimonadota bacterium]